MVVGSPNIDTTITNTNDYTFQTTTYNTDNLDETTADYSTTYNTTNSHVQDDHSTDIYVVKN